MVTESGDVPVPDGARWAALTSTGHADVDGQSADATRTVLNVRNRESIHIAVGESLTGGGASRPEEQMVFIEWLFDADDQQAC